jgi:dTDP-glucose pyrophosphorylase
MNRQLNVLILAAGATFYEDSDGGYPIYLAEFDGTPLLQKIIQALSQLNIHKIIIACRHHDITHYHIGDISQLLGENISLIDIKGSTQGAACTALLAAPDIENDDELLILGINEVMDVSFADVIHSFRSRKLDAGTITFLSIHPRYSYIKLGEDDLVIEASEKRPISQDATASFYWFNKGSDFVAAVKSMIRKDAHIGGNYFVCPAINEMVLLMKRVGRYKIQNDQYHPLKTERQILSYESSSEQKARS